MLVEHLNLRSIPLIPQRVFIILWCDTYKRGWTLTRLASRLGKRVDSVKARGESLIRQGYPLPKLELGEEPQIMDVMQREFTRLDIAEGFRAPCQY